MWCSYQVPVGCDEKTADPAGVAAEPPNINLAAVVAGTAAEAPGRKSAAVAAVAAGSVEKQVGKQVGEYLDT